MRLFEEKGKRACGLWERADCYAFHWNDQNGYHELVTALSDPRLAY